MIVRALGVALGIPLVNRPRQRANALGDDPHTGPRGRDPQRGFLGHRFAARRRLRERLGELYILRMI
jgi:hypothetical protein